MSFLDRLQFWRKHDDMDAGLPPDFGSASYTPELKEDEGGLPALPSMEQYEAPGSSSARISQPLGFERPQAFTQSQGMPPDREIEIISLKLDAIKSELDAINQRLVRVEKLAEMSVNRAGKPAKDVWATY